MSVLLAKTRRAQLKLQSLEAREVPAGVIAVTNSGGVLSLVGDDQNNVATIKIETAPVAQVTITPDATTDVGGGAGVTQIFAGGPTSLKADLKGGADQLSIDATSDFILTGAASFSMGDGSNSLNLATTGKIELGSLSVKGGDGADTFVLLPGAALGKVSGAANLDFGVGQANAILSETSFLGKSGLTASVAKKGGFLSFGATNVTVTKGVNLGVGAGLFGAITFTGCTLGGLTASGDAALLTTNSTTVNGKVSITGALEAELIVQDTTVTGDVSVKASFEAPVRVVGGTFTANNVTISAKIIGYFSGDGTTTTINGNLAISGAAEAEAIFGASTATEVKGKVSLKGGNLLTLFDANSKFKADKDVNITAVDGTSQITIGDGSATVPILGKLSIATGDGLDTVALDNVDVTGNTAIKLGGGSDGLFIDDSSKFSGTFTADLGKGDDLLSIAQDLGLATPVTFVGKATIKGGDGNDTLRLGVGTDGPGDAGSMAVFAAGSKIDGGKGFNTFDDGPGPSSYTGLTFGTSIVNFTDPNP